jgi:hypothetical protein
MGRRRRRAPDRLAQKLLYIRWSLHLTQDISKSRLRPLCSLHEKVIPAALGFKA